MRIGKLSSRRFLVSAATLPLLVGGLVLVTPGAAEAATCGQSWSDKDPSTGAGIVYPNGPFTFPVHNGIYGDCPIKSYMSTGVKLQYDCYRANSYGNSFTHLHLDGHPNVDGWVWDDYLNDGGSLYQC